MKCKAIQKIKTAGVDKDKMKLEMVLHGKRVQPDHAIVDLSGFQLSTIIGMQYHCTKITQLFLHDNSLRTLEVRSS